MNRLGEHEDSQAVGQTWNTNTVGRTVTETLWAVSHRVTKESERIVNSKTDGKFTGTRLETERQTEEDR